MFKNIIGLIFRFFNDFLGVTETRFSFGDKVTWSRSYKFRETIGFLRDEIGRGPFDLLYTFENLEGDREFYSYHSQYLLFSDEKGRTRRVIGTYLRKI